MEYLLLTAVVLGLVFGLGAKPGEGIIVQTRDKARDYFDSGARAIMGGHYDAAGTPICGRSGAD